MNRTQCHSSDASTVKKMDDHVGESPVVHLAKRLHALLVVSGKVKDMFVSARLVNLYSYVGDVSFARRTFNDIPNKDIYTWNSMISAYVRTSRFREALDCFCHLSFTSGLQPNSYTFPPVIKACGSLINGKKIHCQNDDLKTALELFKKMQQIGFLPDLLTLLSLASVVAQLADCQKCKSVHGFILRRGWFMEDVAIGNAVVDMYSKLGAINSARSVFEGLPIKDVISWNTLITGYAQNGLASEAIKLYNTMEKCEELTPNQGTLVSILPAYSHLGDVHQGMKVHGWVIKNNLHMDRDLSSLECHHSCHGLHGHGEKALKLFEDMLDKEVKPDGVTFVSLLSACSHSGLVHMGKHYFHLMLEKYGIKPSRKHYGCMVDLLGRAGHLEEAYNLIKSMPVEPDASIWGALLGSCRIHGNVELDKVRSLARDKGLRKTPGWSSIEINNKVDVFYTGNQTHQNMFRCHLLKLKLNLTTTSIASATTCSLCTTPSYIVTPPIKPWPQRLYPKRLVSIITCQQNLDLALQIFHYAGDFHPGFSHNYETYHAIIRRLSRANVFPAVESLLSDLRKSRLKCGEDLFITVIRSYGLASRPKCSLKTFLRVHDFGVQRSVRSLNCLLNALVQNKRYDLVRWVFENSKNKFEVVPNVFTCNILVKALCHKNDLESALKVLDEMPSLGLVPNVVTYTTIIGGYAMRGDMVGAKRTFIEILDRGWLPDATTYTILMDGYAKQGRLADAIKVMDEMDENGVHPNEVTYGVMIRAYCKENKSGEALNLIGDMLNGNFIPSSALCCKVIDVLCQQGKVEDACELWKKLLKNNCTPDNAVSSTLIYWLCKEGKIWEARKLFDQFERGLIPSMLTYNTLIAGMCEQGELYEAGRLWDDMVEKGCAPNAFTYNMLIKGFCNIGKAQEGIRILEEMLHKKCSPNKSTYAMLIDGLHCGKEEIAKVFSLALASGNIDNDCWDLFFAKMVGNLDTGVIVLDKILSDLVQWLRKKESQSREEARLGAVKIAS
ncbi:hypothetical protein F8388_015941 [Cannabis sativa]|uniref:Pentatricopeptide repeat-containing protein n=1 Tax=Cannabis sativa TaxID=3483 RepID=A0A7J6EEU2_CANSA|nr:hypothetical protein F8388_015941 [Cannabis sativa]